MKTRPIVLISGIGGDIGQSAARALKDRADIVGCDMTDSALARLQTHRFHVVPPARDLAAYMAAVRRIIRQEHVTHFLPIPEPEILALDGARPDLARLGAKILINEPTVIGTFSDKLKTAEFFRTEGWRAPRTCPLEAASAPKWRCPFIVKHRRSWGSHDVRIIRDQADWEHARAKDDGDLIAQEYLPEDGGEYTTGVFCDGKETAALTFRRTLGFGGLSREATLAAVPFLEDMARRVALAVGLKGSINIQSRRIGSVYVPFEVNPRLSSTVYLRHVFGFSDVLWWVQAADGKAFTFRPRYTAGKAYRYLLEGFVDLQPRRR